jgi:transcriptional regulator with XRE-family HTH domain
MKRTLRHALAILRERLGHLTQKELAAYAGTSTWTIQAIELGKLKLSERLAFRISEATGVSYAWLMQNDLSRPPVNSRNEPYSEADLSRAQNKGLQEGRMSGLNGKMELTQAYYILRLIRDKLAKNPDELSFFLSRLKGYLQTELAKIPDMQGPMIHKDKRIDLVMNKDQTAFEVAHIHEYPSLIPVTFESFEMMKLDSYECWESWKEHRAKVEKEIERLNNPEAKAKIRAEAIAKREALLASAKQRAIADPPAKESVTAKPLARTKSRRPSK